MTDINPTNPTGRPATRAEIFAHVMTVLDLSNDTIEELRDVGIVNLTRLRSLTTTQLDDFIINVNSFNIGDKLAIELFQKWTRYYRTTNNNNDPTDWINTFTESVYDNFVNSDEVDSNTNIPAIQNPGTSFPQTPNMGNLNTTPMTVNTSNTVNSGGTENPNTKASLKDYPKFNGSLDKWTEFRHQFLSLIHI